MLAAVGETAGRSAGELAAAAGIARPVIYTLLNRLTERGELVRSALPGGGNGYSLPPEPPASGESAGRDDRGTGSSGDATRDPDADKPADESGEL